MWSERCVCATAGWIQTVMFKSMHLHVKFMNVVKESAAADGGECGGTQTNICLCLILYCNVKESSVWLGASSNTSPDTHPMVYTDKHSE